MTRDDGQYPVGICDDEWCEYPEPHRHGFACDRQCLCFGVGPETVPLTDDLGGLCDWGDCQRVAVAGRLTRWARNVLPVCSWHAGWDDTP